jgi:hypothetical protein
MIVVVICETSVSIDKKSREVCVGARCIKYETEEQFKAVYDLVMEIASFCGVKMLNEMLRNKIYREGGA